MAAAGIPGKTASTKAGSEPAGYQQPGCGFVAVSDVLLVQQVPEFTRRGVEEHKGNYNIWYGKYENTEGHRGYDRGKVGTNPETRCVVATDTGKTKADTHPSSLLCYLFAQGRCHHGPECNFLHRIPDEVFEASLEHARDCFGRKRHGTDADGMGGVGNFMRNSRTLYIGNIRVGREKDNLEKRIREHFGEWGELEVVKVFPNRAIGFVTYRLRTSAEFAKIAMADQNAGGGPSEVLNVRWASEDPNPKAIEHKKRKNIEAVEEHLAKKGFTGTGDAAFEYPSDYKLPRAAADFAGDGDGQDGLGAEGDYWSKYYEQQAMALDSSLSYPETDAQFEAALDRADTAAREEVTAKSDLQEAVTHDSVSGGCGDDSTPQGYSTADIFGDTTPVGETTRGEGAAPADADAAKQLQEQWAAYYQQQQWAAYYQQQHAWEQQMQAAATSTNASPARWPSADSSNGRSTAAIAEAAPKRNIGPRPPPSKR